MGRLNTPSSHEGPSPRRGRWCAEDSHQASAIGDADRLATFDAPQRSRGVLLKLTNPDGIHVRQV
jgi:hypothetical protein